MSPTCDGLTNFLGVCTGWCYNSMLLSWCEAFRNERLRVSVRAGFVKTVMVNNMKVTEKLTQSRQGRKESKGLKNFAIFASWREIFPSLTSV